MSVEPEEDKSLGMSLDDFTYGDFIGVVKTNQWGPWKLDRQTLVIYIEEPYRYERLARRQPRIWKTRVPA
jgi:hypothetical protein